MSRTPIRVFIIEPHHLVRLGLISALSDDPGIVFVGQAETEAAASSTLEGLSVDVFLLNDEDGPAGLDTCRRLRAGNSEAGIVLLVADSNSTSMLNAIDAGANACCLRDITAHRLMAAIIGVSYGDLWVDSQIAWQLMDKFRIIGNAQPSATAQKSDADCSLVRAGSSDDTIFLTAREGQVLKLIVRGQTNQAIADSLIISLATAKAHVRSILSKLGVDHRTQAAVEAMRRGLV